jgi:hypothetical protein
MRWCSYAQLLRICKLAGCNAFVKGWCLSVVRCALCLTLVHSPTCGVTVRTVVAVRRLFSVEPNDYSRLLAQRHLNFESATQLWDIAESLGLDNLSQDIVSLIQDEFEVFVHQRATMDELEFSDWLGLFQADLMFRVVYPGRIQGEAKTVAQVKCVCCASPELSLVRCSRCGLKYGVKILGGSCHPILS